MKVEIWSDVVCPWCYVGKRRFESALELFDEEVEVEWRSFELDPSAPQSTDLPLDQALARKYRMPLERAREMMENMRAMAEEEGLEFNFEKAQGGNTFDAHRLIQFAKNKGEGDAMKERLLRAYFTEGKPITDHETLVELAEEAGLDSETARATLLSDGYEEEVRADEREARQIGVTGVPFFLIDGQYGVSGAQSPDTLVKVLEQVREKSKPTAPDAAACDDEACEV